MTSVTTSVPSTLVTRSRTLPSSMRSGSPIFTSPGSPLYVVRDSFASPRMSRVVMVKVAPFFSFDRAVREQAEPDLGALEVGEDADAVT